MFYPNVPSAHFECPSTVFGSLLVWATCGGNFNGEVHVYLISFVWKTDPPPTPLAVTCLMLVSLGTMGGVILHL